MADIELSLDSLKFANVYGFERKFGKKKDSSQNGGSLLTREFNEANALPFDVQRPVRITGNTRVTRLEYDARLELVSDTEVTAVLCGGGYTGQTVTVYNTSEVAHTLEVNGEEFPLSAGKEVTLVWAGRWKAECRVPVDDVYVQYGGMKFPQELFPCTKWENISKNYEGEFFRVAGGNSASQITEYSGGSVYAYKHQDDCMQGHRHLFRGNSDTQGNIYINNRIAGAYQVEGFVNGVVGDAVSDGKNGTPRVGTETRPVNSAVQLWRRVS